MAATGCEKKDKDVDHTLKRNEALYVRSVDALIRNFEPWTLSTIVNDGNSHTNSTVTIDRIVLDGELRQIAVSTNDQRKLNPLCTYQFWGNAEHGLKKIAEFETPWQATFLSTNNTAPARFVLEDESKHTSKLFESPKLPLVTLSHGGKLAIAGIINTNEPGTAYVPKETDSSEAEKHITYEKKTSHPFSNLVLTNSYLSNLRTF